MMIPARTMFCVAIHRRLPVVRRIRKLRLLCAPRVRKARRDSIEAGLSKVGDSAPNTPLPSPTETEHLVGIVSVEKAMLYTAPNDARASRAYLVRNDTVTVLKQVPTGWAYVDYVNASGKHLLRWSKAEQLTIKP